METIKSALLRCNGFIKRISPSRELKRANSTVGNDRYEVCQLLASTEISCAIWLEDVLAVHGSNTQVWDLHLLVEDPHATAKVFLDSSYKEIPPVARFEDDPEFSERTTRVARFQSSTAVVLHHAKDWYFHLDDSIPEFLPPIYSFLDSMIEFWLNISSRDYVDRLGFALYIGCLRKYCYDLQTSDGGPVKNPAYAESSNRSTEKCIITLPPQTPRRECHDHESSHLSCEKQQRN